MKSMTDNDALGALIAPDTLRIERILPGPADRVWSYLVEGEKRRKWLAGGEVDDRVGGQVELKFRHSDFTSDTPPERFADINKNGFTSQCRITEYDPPRLLAFTWPGDSESEVQFELFEEGSKVRLVLTHKRLVDAGQMLNVASGWHAHLEVLRNELAGEGEDRFWTRVVELQEIYRERLA